MKLYCINRQVYCLAALFAALILLSIPAVLSADEVSDNIRARAAVVLEGNTGKILYAKNPNTRLQPASTAKLVTAMVVFDRLDPDTVVTVSKEAARIPTVSPRLRPGEKLTVRDLLNLTLIRSVNSAAVALAEAVAGSEKDFVPLMNEKVKAIGAENTAYINASGLPGEGQHITAYDLSLIMKKALRYPGIREIINTRLNRIYTENGRGLFVRNTNHLLWNDDDVVGGKTGFTRSAGHCLAFAVQKGEGVLITSILGESVRGNIWQDSNMLLRAGEDVLANRRAPELYYTADAEDPIKVVTSKKRKRNRAVASRASSGHKSSKYGVAVKAAKKKKVKSKGSMAGVGGKKRTGEIS
jgi:serine-type D-Ala-D-Ala carboxypeptidase (penicillin-binding protein 5/6)